MTAPLAELWRAVTGGEPPPVRVEGAADALPGPFRVGELAAACVGAVTGAAAEIGRLRGATPGAATVDIRHAAAAFRSEALLRVDGAAPADPWAELSGNYRGADGWVRLHCNYPAHADAVCAALGVPGGKAAVTAAVAGRRCADIVEAVQAAGGAAAELRAHADWLAHPQGAAVAAEPLVSVTPIAPAPARPLGSPRDSRDSPHNSTVDRALSGLRVLELTHVIAGPVCGRTLAAHGADVLHVGAAHLPTIPTLSIDTGFGKRSTHIDLRHDAATLAALAADADVFVQSFRPGSLAARGFSAAALAEANPGIVVVELDAYGWSGPWAGRRGFDSLVQLACGIAAEDASEVDGPAPLPAQALDHGTGWLAAFGALIGLRRRATEGGSWLVRLSLARTAQWLWSLGRTAGAPAGDVSDLMRRTGSPFGTLEHVAAPGTLPGLDPQWTNPPPLPGSAQPAWV